MSQLKRKIILCTVEGLINDLKDVRPSKEAAKALKTCEKLLDQVNEIKPQGGLKLSEKLAVG